MYKKPYILFSPEGEYFYETYEQASHGQKIHGGCVTKQKLYSNQSLSLGGGI